MRHRFLAGWAPGSPEINEDGFEVKDADVKIKINENGLYSESESIKTTIDSSGITIKSKDN